MGEGEVEHGNCRWGESQTAPHWISGGANLVYLNSPYSTTSKSSSRSSVCNAGSTSNGQAGSV